MLNRWLVLFLALSLLPLVVEAQPADPQQHTEHVAAPPADEVTEWTANLGAILNTGNTRSLSLNAGSRLNLQRSFNAFAAELQIVYGRASIRGEDGEFADAQVNAENVSGKVRYDRFFSAMDAAFIAAVGRRDRFAGLDARLQGQIGYLRNFYKVENHRFWGELGYDFTYDDFEPDPLLDPDGNELEGTETLHSVRAFLGYDNHLNEAVTFLTGLESLFDVQDLDNIRLAWASELRSKVATSLQVGVNFTLRYDNVPVPGTEKLDTTTTLTLLYSLL